MMERNGLVTMKGNPLTLLGEELKVGQKAPECVLVANDLSEVKLSSFKGKKLIIASVPSLDTGICDMETKKFNTEAVQLDGDTMILTISTDLPFAQKRWCGSTGVNKVTIFSDHRDVSFGTAYGVLIKGLRILARAIFVIDSTGVLQYFELVKEVTTEPNYAAALEAAKKAK